MSFPPTPVVSNDDQKASDQRTIRTEVHIPIEVLKRVSGGKICFDLGLTGDALKARTDLIKSHFGPSQPTKRVKRKHPEDD